MANRLKADMAGIIFDLGRNLKNGNSIGNVRGKLLALPVFRKGSSISVARPVANGFYASAGKTLSSNYYWSYVLMFSRQELGASPY